MNFQFHSLPLYLEWAPVDGVGPPVVDENADAVEESTENAPNEKDESKVILLFWMLFKYLCTLNAKERVCNNLL